MIDLGRQWNDRLKLWAERFPKHYLRRAMPLEARYTTTMEQLTPADARGGRLLPAPAGTRWGRKWEYGWFFAEFTVPPELAGEWLVLELGFGPEMLVWIDGEEAGSIDRQHTWLPLTPCARGGRTYRVAAEVYAGHGPRLEGAGPVGWEEVTVPEPPETQVTVAPSYLSVWNEPLFQTAMDYLALYSLLGRLPPRSLRAMKVAQALKDFTCQADFELPEPELTRSVVEAGAGLKPLLACKNGSTAPTFTVFGQSHLDMAWLWPVAETMRKTARTYANQLALMEEYPEYRFLLCEPPIPEYLKTLYPRLYRRVRDRVEAGALVPEGAMWIESDTNIPAGESLIRQFVRGKRWFRREYGVESRLAWMPDTFGFSAQLPQIMVGCGVPYFATQKLLRQDPEAAPFPYNLFWWEGLDGSRVLAHVYKKNNAVFTPAALVERWEDDRNQAEGLDGMLFPFGYGDGGGGPTREMLEQVRRCADLEGAPRCRMESPVAYFDRIPPETVENRFRGELYLAWHRGTYTAQSETKRLLRRAEGALKGAEFALAQALAAGEDIAPLRPRLEELWGRLLFDQFHDIAAGASIRRVHAEAEADLAGVIDSARALTAQVLGTPGVRTAAYNPLGWPVTYRGYTVPAQGWVQVGKYPAWAPHQMAALRPLPEGGWQLENCHLVCRVNGRGELVSLRLAGEDREYMAAPGNRLELFKDVNTCYDAWEVGSMYRRLPVALDEPVTVTPESDEDGVSLVVRRTLHRSTLTQRIRLGHDARRLDFVTTLDWQERHKLLKVSFPLDIHTDHAVHEVPFGQVSRPNHTSRQSDRDQYEVCAHRYSALCDGGVGAAVLNDGKYGVSAEGNDLRLTLLRAPVMPDMEADRGEHTFTYAIYPFRGELAHSGVLREAAALNEPPILGDCPGKTVPRPLLLSHTDHVVVDTVKPADTREDAVLVRVYEAMGVSARADLRVSDAVTGVWETDMLEEQPRPLTADDLTALAFRPFEIKTLLLRL